MSLTQEDLNAIGTLLDTKLDSRFADMDAKWDAKLDSRFADMDAKWDAKLIKSETMLLDEMDRLHNGSSKKIDTILEKLNYMQQEINATRYSNETVELLLRKTVELDNRMMKLEMQTA